MAELVPIRVNELPEVTEVNDSDYLVIDDGTQTSKITSENYNAEASGSAKRYADEALLSAQNAAQSEGNASASEQNAGNSETNALTYSRDSEAWAKGTRNGTAVTSEDAAYHNNSEYFADQAHESAAEAAQSADDAASAAASFTTDTTLSVSGKAADAKATGDAISEVAASVPDVDDTLAIAGDAADAKKTGDELSNLKSAFDGVPGTQLFDKNNATILNGLINSSKKFASNNGTRSVVVPVSHVSDSVTVHRSMTLSRFAVAASSTFAIVNGTELQNYTQDNSASSLTIPINNSTVCVVIYFLNTSAGDSLDDIDTFLSGLMVQYGDQYTGYESYTLYQYLDGAKIQSGTVTLEKLSYGIAAKENQWLGKTILWMGTSIQAGEDATIGQTYPKSVCDALGASCINIALGSSMCRASTRTGNYVEGLSYNIMYALTQTVEEKQYLIDNWSTVRTVLHDPNTLETLSDSQKATMLASSFENRLLPYLDGTYDMPDLFVIDHGHNDWKPYYTLPDGTTPDIGLEPTVENISGDILAEDTYMTANDCAKLTAFLGSLADIPASKKAAFLASINRNCFKGAVGFICTLILHYNPRAKIVLIGNIDTEKQGLTQAQDEISYNWCYPIAKIWNQFGLGGHYIPGTATTWDVSGTTDLTQKNVYVKDNVHPYSDTTGEMTQRITKVLVDFLFTVH